jgi:hypothetical protein
MSHGIDSTYGVYDETPKWNVARTSKRQRAAA